MATSRPVKLQAPSPAAARIVPAIVVIGAVSAVAAYVRTQLRTESRNFDRYFAAYKSPQSEASRHKVFDGAIQDPRKSWFNVLGW